MRRPGPENQAPPRLQPSDPCLADTAVSCTPLPSLSPPTLSKRSLSFIPADSVQSRPGLRGELWPPPHTPRRPGRKEALTKFVLYARSLGHRISAPACHLSERLRRSHKKRLRAGRPPPVLEVQLCRAPGRRCNLWAASPGSGNWARCEQGRSELMRKVLRALALCIISSTG